MTDALNLDLFRSRKARAQRAELRCLPGRLNSISSSSSLKRSHWSDLSKKMSTGRNRGIRIEKGKKEEPLEHNICGSFLVFESADSSNGG